MQTKDWSEFRTWVEAVAAGARAVTADEVVAVVRELLDEIDSLHNRYAHEGGKPQLLTVNILIEWVQALDVPTMENIYSTRTIPNVFTADFAVPLEARHIRQLEALGLTVVDTEYPAVGRGRYMLTWQPPRSDE